MSYTLTQGAGVIRDNDGAFIPDDPANSDYAAYLEWVAAGNAATPYAVPDVPVVEPTKADLQAQLAALQEQMLAIAQQLNQEG